MTCSRCRRTDRNGEWVCRHHESVLCFRHALEVLEVLPEPPVRDTSPVEAIQAPVEALLHDPGEFAVFFASGPVDGAVVVCELMGWAA